MIGRRTLNTIVVNTCEQTIEFDLQTCQHPANSRQYINLLRWSTAHATLSTSMQIWYGGAVYEEVTGALASF